MVFFGLARGVPDSDVADGSDAAVLVRGQDRLLLFVFIWIRATLPRFRYDQLMGFAWKFMFPVACSTCWSPALLVAAFDVPKMDIILLLSSLR